MNTDELKTLLAMEPTWTVSVGGQEAEIFVSEDVEISGRSIRLRRIRHVIESITWLRHNVVRVRVRRPYRSQTDVLTFYPGAQRATGLEARRHRRAFQKHAAVALARYFGASVVALPPASGRPVGVSAAYPRFRAGSRAAIAVHPDEPSPVVDGIMRAAILWAAVERRKISVVVPAGRRANLVARLENMPRLAGAFEWLQWDDDGVYPLDPAETTQTTRVEKRRQPGVSVEAQAARILSLCPDLLRAFPHAGGGAISIRLRGLEVARISDRGATFPMGASLETVVEDLGRKRRYGSRHPLARAFEERWLESSLVDHLDRILPAADLRYVYPQVPSFTGQQRQIVDLLTVTREGRLAVIEVKVGADPDLPFQALDYWLAVERHRKAGDFQPAGYFEGIEILDRPALLIVAAPLLSFHKTFDRLVSFFPAEVPLTQLGLSDLWKKEIRVLRRKGAVE
ncbi:MAG TPA: hypothetical protein VFY29_06805 [Terriglobia bacterium]|nr:hypothetical protein [Terriglobia bacterium]